MLWWWLDLGGLGGVEKKVMSLLLRELFAINR